MDRETLAALRSDEEAGGKAPGEDVRQRSAYEERVMRAFIVDGRLASIPAREKKRLVVLRHLAETIFQPDRDYSEKEANQRLAVMHRDVAALRRYLVVHGFMQRAGGIYRLRPEADWPESPRSGSMSP